MNSSSSQNLTNEELLKKIEQLKYESRFGCISNSYYRYVMEREVNLSPRLLIYADFNDIGKCNKKYGFKTTSKFMKKTLTDTVNYLSQYYHKNIDCVCLGGDEFLFIVNNINTQDDFSKLLENIQKDVFSHSKLSMSLGFSHTNEKSITNSSLQETLQRAQKMSETNKQQEKNSKNKSLQDKLLFTLTTYLNAIPIDKISNEEKNTLLNKTLEIFQNGFPNYYSSRNSTENTSESDTLPCLPLNWKSDSEQLEEISNYLGTNPITSGIRRSAIPGIIDSHEKESFYCSYIDISNLKLSNLLCGHENTDKNIKKIINKIRTIFAEEGIDISTFDYSSNPNFVVNLTGCKFMILISKNNSNINFEKLNTILQKIQKECSKGILGFTYSTSTTPTKLTSLKKFDRIESKLKKQCNKKKVDYRQNRYIAPDTPKLWLEDLILQIVKDYTSLGYENFEFDRILRPALISAFDSLPTIRNAENEFFNNDNFKPSQNRYNREKLIQSLRAYLTNNTGNSSPDVPATSQIIPKHKTWDQYRA